MSKVQDPIGRIADEFSNDPKVLKCKTYKEVYDVICDALALHYRCPKRYVEPYADDIAESVCLKLNISQD